MNRLGAMSPDSSRTSGSGRTWVWLLLAFVAVAVLGTIAARTFYGERSSRLHQMAGATMGTTWSLKVSLPDGAPAAWVGAIGDTVQSRLDRIEGLMSTWDSTSELSRFNGTADTAYFPLSPETVAVLEIALDVGAASGGALDVTVGPLVAAWGFGPGGAPDRAPTASALDRLRPLLGLDRIHLDARRGSAMKTHPGVQLDLSAIAKGYALDLAAAGVRRMGGSDFALEVGGEVRAHGVRPDGTAWRVAIETPTPESRTIFRVLELRDQAVATSGDYRNFIEVDGTRFSHLLDPRSGSPIPWRGFSVSVVHSEAAQADAWSTALSVLGPDEGLALAERLELSVVFVVPSEDGRFELRYTGDVGRQLQL